MSLVRRADKRKNNEIGDDAIEQCNVKANEIKCSYVGKESREEELKVTQR